MWPNVVGVLQGPVAQPPLSPKGYSKCTLCVGCVHPPLVVEPWLLLSGQWEGFTQASQLQGLAVTTDHQSLPSVEDQLFGVRVVVLQHGL